MARRIRVTGSEKPALVSNHNYEIVARFQWHAVAGPGGTHAATEIVGQEVLMEDLIFWAALEQGDQLTATGQLAGLRPQPLSAAAVQQRLEERLRETAMKDELTRAINLANSRLIVTPAGGDLPM